MNQATPPQAPSAEASAEGAAARAPLAQDQLDPLDSPVLRNELPGLPVAFDEAAMLDHLQAALQPNPGYVIEQCELDQATYVAGEYCIVRYRLTVQDAAGGPSIAPFVVGRVFPDQRACAAYSERLTPIVELSRGREEFAPFAAPATIIAPLHMAVYVFPIDGDLPALAAATERGHMLDVFRQALPESQNTALSFDDCLVELVDYGRQNRCTLRYTIKGEIAEGREAWRRVVYGKLTADGSGALAAPLVAALSAWVTQGGYQFNIPRSFGWLPDMQLALLDAIPGDPRIPKALKARLRGEQSPAGALPLEEMIDDCALIAASLHTSGIRLGPRRTLDDELTRLRQSIQTVERISPALGARLREAIEQVAAYAARSTPLDLGLCHGDFTYTQLIFDGIASGLVDFDSICQAEPALDLGQFLTYLRIAGLKAQKSAPPDINPVVEELGARFLKTYIAAMGDRAADAEQLRARVAVYEIISLLRRALRSWQKFKVKRIESALAVLEERCACLV